MLARLLHHAATMLAEGGVAASRRASPASLASSPSAMRYASVAPAAEAAGGARILDGKGVAAAWQVEIARDVRRVTADMGRPPGLAVVLVGDRPDSQIYVHRKHEACQRVGITSLMRQLPATVSQLEIEAAVRELCQDDAVDGVLVQLPLPDHLNEESIIESFDPAKDVDGFHPLNMGRILMRGRAPSFVPCTALGCMELLLRSGVDVRGKTAVILGDSNVVGMPLSMLLRNAGVAALTSCHRNSYEELFQGARSADGPHQRAQAQACGPTLPGPLGQPAGGEQPEDQQPQQQQQEPEQQQQQLQQPVQKQEQQPQQQPQEAVLRRAQDFGMDLPDVLRHGDILIVAVGCPELVKASWVKPGAVVIDVGINVVGPMTGDSPPGDGPGSGQGPDGGLQRGRVAERDEGYKGPQHHVVGDVDFLEVSRVASAITPVPGGVGPMTIAALLQNTVVAARLGLERRQRSQGTSELFG